MDGVHRVRNFLNPAVEIPSAAGSRVAPPIPVAVSSSLPPGIAREMAARRPRKASRPRAKKSAPAKVENDLAAMKERTDLLYAALGLPENARRGDRGTLGGLNEAVVKIQDYLLRSSERIDHILGTLKNHRELLVKMNQRIYHVGTRERIRIELDIMKNTLSILGLTGVEFDEGLLPEIQRLRESTAKEDADLPALRKSKEKLDRRFDTEVRKVDAAAVHRQKAKDVPGYR